MIISEIRRQNTYLSRATKVRTNKRLRDGGTIGSKTDRSCAEDKTRD